MLASDPNTLLAAPHGTEQELAERQARYLAGAETIRRLVQACPCVHTYTPKEWPCGKHISSGGLY